MDRILMIILLALGAVAAFAIGVVLVKQRRKHRLEDPKHDHLRRRR